MGPRRVHSIMHIPADPAPPTVGRQNRLKAMDLPKNVLTPNQDTNGIACSWREVVMMRSRCAYSAYVRFTRS